MTKNDGGSAFPGGLNGEYWEHNGENKFSAEVYGGMKLRDWFAGQVIASVLSATPDWSIGNEHEAAKVAYVIADALIRERDR